MRIAFLNLYSGVNNRGAESFAHKLGLVLISKGYQVDFYTGRQVETKIIQPEHNMKNPLKRLFLDPPSLSVLVFTLKVLPDMWKKKYDWFVPMNSFWQVVICKLIVLFRGGRILITGHSGPGWDERWNLYLKPDVFVATTDPTASWAKKTCPWTNVVTIPYGIEIDTWKNARPEKLDLEHPVILCSAAAVEYKRVDTAIKAVAKMKKGSLLYLGTGPLLLKLNDLGKKLLGKRYLNKAVPYDEMPKYYAACDFATLPSSSQENSPMTFLEAIASGKITVATDAPRPRWILGDAGIFVDPNDTAEYAKALEEAAKIKDKTVINLWAKRYSWEKIIEEYEKQFSSNPHQD